MDAKLLCVVEMRIKIREIIKTVERWVKTYQDDSEVTEESIFKENKEIEDKIFTVNGFGASDGKPIPKDKQAKQTTKEKRVIIE